MPFTIRESQTDEDMEFMYRSCFDTAKSTDAIQYTGIKQRHPEANEDTAFQLFRQEIIEYFDFSRDDCRIIIAEDEKKEYAGYIWVALRDSEDPWDLERPVWIFDINVQPKFRRQGLGRLLLQRGEDFAKELDRNIGLFVHSSNARAISLYRSSGYADKNYPVSIRLQESDEVVEPLLGTVLRELTGDDHEMVVTLGLNRFRRKVLFSNDASDEAISQRYQAHLANYGDDENRHSRYTLLSDQGDLIAYLWAGIAHFSDQFGLIYDLVIDEEKRTREIETYLVRVFKRWSYQRGLSGAYVLLHTEDDLKLDTLRAMGFKVPGIFMEKRLK
jgi:ribosomal protein S18 acetylase RimI-like enzyme